MRFPIFITGLFLVLTTCVLAAPVEQVDLTSLNFPPEDLTSLLNSKDGSSALTCPTSNDCGVITFNSGTYAGFGEGICMQLSGNIQSIYVAHCYCSIWSKCTGHSKTSEYVDGMMMCQKPREASSFKKEPKFISCGGLHSPA